MVTPEAALAVIRAARPELRSTHDRVAFALHATFMASGYSLAAAGPRAASLNQGEFEEAGTQGWDEMDGGYAFKYFTDQRSLAKVVDVRCTVINDLLMIDVAAANNEVPPIHKEIKVTDYANENGGGYNHQYKNFDGLVKMFNTDIIGKLAKTDRDRGKVSIEPEGPRSVYTPPYTGSEGSGYGHGPGSFPITGVGRSDMIPCVGAGIFDSRMDAGFESGEGGNVVGPHHSIFTGPMRTDFVDGGVPVRPPGARFDGFGPPGVPGFEPERFGRGAGRRDLQHFP